jgi:phage terminase large subunit
LLEYHVPKLARTEVTGADGGPQELKIYMAVREIEIPYAPRKAFMPFHNRTQRWACLVAHRRAGKTVAAINDIIRAAITSKDPMPLFGFVAPFRSQAKSVVWDYLKHYSLPIAADSNEAELTVTLINGAKIRLFGADNADAIRGLGILRHLHGRVRGL